MFKALRNAAVKNPPMQTLVRALSRSGVLPPAIYSRLPVYGQHAVSSPAGNSFNYVAGAYDLLARSVVWGNLAIWEKASLHAWSRLARTARRVLDVGAYSGIYSLIACVDGPADVIAFEPNPEARALLEGNIRANHLAERITVVQKGASAMAGTARMHIPADNTAARVDRHAGGPWVELTTIDEVLAGRSADLIKIDAEGLEPDILLGAHLTMAQHHPALIMECLNRASFDALQSITTSYGYNPIWHLSSTGAKRVRDFVEEPQFANFLWRVDV